MGFTLVLVKFSVLEDLYRKQVFPSDGSTVVPSLSSPADLAGKVKLRRRRSADVGIAIAISKPGLPGVICRPVKLQLRHLRAVADRLRSLSTQPRRCVPACWPVPRSRRYDGFVP